MYGHPIAKQLENWWKEHGGNPKSKAWQAYVKDRAALMVSKDMESVSEHDNDGRFGMSKAGGCVMAATLKFLGHESAPMDGSTLATFQIGHDIETMGLASLRAIGYEVEPFGPDGKQFTARIDPFMHSASDGQMVLDSLRTIVSVKSAGYKTSGYDYKSKKWRRFGFAQYPFDGVQKTSPGYYAQCQAEMHATGLTQTLFLVVAKDIIKAMKDDPYLGPGGNGSLTFYAEVVRYDEAFVKDALLPVWAEAWQQVQRGEIGRALVLNGSTKQFVELEVASPEKDPNRGKTGSYNPCLYCDLFNACKKANNKTAAA